MFTTLGILLPIFALILAGFFCRRRNLLGPTGASEINRFVVWLALPALLLHVTADATYAQFDHPSFFISFSLSCLLAFLLVLVVRMLMGRHLVDASIDAIAASYPNTGYIGLPLCVLLFADTGLALAAMSTIIVACILFALAIALIEIGLQKERAPHKILGKVVFALLKNPLIAAPLLGALLNVADVPLGHVAETFLKFLGDAASPCALVSLGAFLAEKRNNPTAASTANAVTKRRLRRMDPAWVLSVVKLVGQPLIAWWLTAIVFKLSTTTVQAAVLLAALSTGTGPFMLAEFYRREAIITSRVILYSTAASLVTLTIIMTMLHVHL